VTIAGNMVAPAASDHRLVPDSTNGH
jgi:hypothetical protein